MSKNIEKKSDVIDSFKLLTEGSTDKYALLHDIHYVLLECLLKFSFFC